MNLTQHSLHDVLARDKTLWKQPIKWTRSHLLVLGVRHSRRRRRCGDEEEDSNDSEQEVDCDRGNGNEEEIHHVALPDLTERSLNRKITFMKTPDSYEARVRFITGLLCLPLRFVDGVVYRPFTTLWTTPQLAVGTRTYKLHRLYHFLLDDKLVLPYLDSSAIQQEQGYVGRRRDRIRPFEPFITAVFIGRAQSLYQPSCSNCSGTGDKNTENNTVANKPITVGSTISHDELG
ncbi:hypothetical protein NUW58_g10684 [Xylaria curta]|uniref:Uncharacterized protein n=1 Tax=Xylaria curta TaxID=42375 RepID=A0ACC1MJA4_9PEZI|nr:hypothetical protein NUW58_g10684 [Xylaria curta]